MPAVVDEARVLAGEAHAAWSESFNEMFAQAAGAFANAAVRRHGHGRSRCSPVAARGPRRKLTTPGDNNRVSSR